jgi:hypothetical protein
VIVEQRANVAAGIRGKEMRNRISGRLHFRTGRHHESEAEKRLYAIIRTGTLAIQPMPCAVTP